MSNHSKAPFKTYGEFKEEDETQTAYIRDANEDVIASVICYKNMENFNGDSQEANNNLKLFLAAPKMLYWLKLLYNGNASRIYEGSQLKQELAEFIGGINEQS